LTSLDGRTGTWRCEISLSEWDELLRTGVITRDAHGVANLSFTATTADTAGNVAVNYAAFSLDRDVPAAPVLGAAVRQIAGDTTSAQSATSLYRATTLADAMQGVILAPHAPAPLSSDIATITVDATTVEPMTDQWRLGSALWFMSASVTETPLTLNDGAAALSLIYAYDTANHRLIIQQAGGGAFTPQQVQQVLGQLAWVNTSSDATLEQSDRVFTWRFIDAYGNVSTPSSVTFAVDTQAPLTLTQLSMTTAVTGTPLDGTVIVNSLNASNTALQLSATIGAGEATGGYAEFYIGSTRVGTSELIGESDTVVSYTTRHNAAVTSSAAELQNDITSSGVLRVKLFDQVGNVVSAEGPMLLRDVTPPDIVRMTSSTPDGAYKAGDSIALSAHTSEAVADDRSTLVATLNTRDALQFGSADRTVILNRDATHPTLFVGSYTVQPGDTSADLAVSRVSLNSAVGAQAPRDAAGNALNLDITSLPVADTLSGSKSLVIDTTAPRIVQIYSSTPNGTYKAADAITLNVLTNESIANDGSTLLLTLNIGSAGQPEVPNRTVTLTRDSVNSTLFTGVYRVQAGDTSADLSVTRVTWDPVLATPAPVDAAGNALNWAIDSLASAMTLAGSSDIAIDTTAPTLLTQVAISTAVTGTASDGVVAPNTLNSTNTAMKFTATIGAGEATGGYAEFYVGNVRMGTSRPIGVTDTTVSYVTELAGVQTATAAALQSKIADGGLVSVKLYDQAGNFITAGGPTLMRDVTPPVVLSNVMVTTAVTGTPGDGTVVVNTLNGTNTALKLSATIGVGEATGGYAEFYVGNSRIGTSRLITGTDTTVEYITNINGVITTTAQALQSLIATGGTVSVRLYDEARNLLSATGRDLQFDITAPSALDLVSGGVVNTSSTEYYSAAIAGTDTPLMPRVGAVRETDIATITVIVSGADALNDILKFGAVELALNSTARSGSASVGNVNVDWTYSPSQVLTFTKAGGDAWTTADIQTLENGLKFRTYLTAAMGTRLFGVTHIDLAGNASVLSTQSVAVDAAAPNAPDLDAISSGVQRTSVTYYGLANLGANKPIAALVDASQNDIALITMAVGGVADSRNQLVVGTASQVLNPSALASGSNVTINGVSGVDWSYSVGKVLTLTRTGGGAFSAAQVRDIERGLSFNATAGATAGARTFTLQNTDLAGNASATSLQTVLVDVVVPTINTVDIKGYTPLGVPKSILGVGDQVRVELTLSEGVIVDTTLGTPSYRIVLDTGGTVSATYVSGSGTSTLVFSYTVAPSNSDSNGGITPAASPLNFNGGTVLDLAGNACSVASLPSPAVNTLRVDTAAPSPVTNMTVLDANMPASTNGTVKALNSSLFQLMSARGVHYGFNNTSAITISYRQDDGSSLTFSFNDSTSYTGTGQLRTGVLNAFASSTLGQAGLFDFSIDGSSGSGFSSNGSGSPSSSGDGVTRMMWMYLQAKPGKVVDASKLTFSNSFYYWLPSTAVAGNPGATAVTYDAAVGWGNNTPTVPGNASVNTGLGLSTTQLAVGGHINSGSVSGNGWLYQYQGLVRSTPTSEPVVDTLADNRLVFDFSSAGGIAKSTVLSTVSAGEGRLTAADALTVLNLWRGRFTPNAGALPTFAELFGAATTFNVSAQDITSTGGEGYMVSYQYVTGSTTLVSKVTIDLGATSVKSKLLGGRFTFGSTVLKLPNAWATDGGTQVNPQPTFDITLPAGVEEGSVITLYDGTTSTGIVIGTKFITAAEVARGFASLAVSPDTPFANTSFGVVTHVLSAKVTDNAGNVATNDGFYNYAFVDGTGPAVRAVRVWGANAAGTAKTTPLVAGDQVMVTLVWDDAPVVTGVPTYALSINGVTKTATYQSTNGKDMVLSYLVTAADSSLGVTATATALTLGVGVTIQDVLGKSASLATPVVAAIDSPVVIANPRGELTGEQAQALAWGASQPTFALSYDGALAQVGDQLVLMENGVKVGSRVLTSSDMGAGQHTLNVIADSSLVSGIHAITFQYQDNTGAVTPYKVNGTPVTEYVSVGAHASVPALTLDALNLDNEGGQAGRSLSDWSLYQSTSDPDLVFTGTVDQAATVTVYATSTTTGVMQTVGAQQVLANSAFTISETAFSLAPDVYAFKVVAQNSTGQVAAVSTGPVGVFATSTANDTVLGTAGNDRINVGEGNNTVSTGHGQDVVYLGGYGALASNSGTSTTTITDFKLGQDKIDLTSVFTPGTVNTSNFMQFVSQSVSNGDTTLTIDSNGSAAGGTNHSVVLKNVSQVPLDSSVFNFIVL
jgi:hypothetical protein